MTKRHAASDRAVAAAHTRGGVAPAADDAPENSHASHRMLSTLLGNLPGMAYRCRNDQNWTMEFISEGCLPLTGFPPSEFLHNAVRSYADIIHPEDRDRIWNDVQDSLAAGCSFQIEYRIVHARGDSKWVWEQGRGVYGPEGTLLGLEGFITDISERKRVEARLRESEARFRALLDLSSDWFWECDAALRFTRLEGREVERDASLSERFIGKHPWDADLWLENAEDNERAQRALLEPLEPFLNVMMYTHAPDGSRYYMSVSGEPMFDRDGGFQGYRGITRDVSRYKRAEQFTLRLSKMYAALSATNEAMLRVQSPGELYQKVCEAAVHGGGFTATVMVLAAPGQEWARVAAFAGAGTDYWRRLRVSMDETRPEGRGLVGNAYRSGQPCISSDATNDERARPWLDQIKAIGTASSAAIPMFQGGRCIGAWLFQSNEKNAFDEEIVRLLQRMAENVSFALETLARAAEQKQAEQATLRLSKMYAVLSATNEAILRAHSPEELYQKVCDAAVHGGKLIAAAAMLIEPGDAWVKLIVFSGVDEWRNVRISVDSSHPEGRGLVGAAYRARKPAISNDYLNDERLRPWREKSLALGVNAAAAIPLGHGEHVTGMLLFYSREKDAFDEETITLFERMAENVTFALDNFARAKEQQRAAEALRESEARFKSLTELSSDWYWEQDEQFRFTRFEGRYVMRSRSAFDGYLGKQLWDDVFETEGGDGRLLQVRRAMLESREPFYNLVLYARLPDGSRICMNISGEPFSDAQGNFKGYRGTGRDITERVRALALTRKLSSAIQQTADCVMITDRNGVIEYVNEAFERITGYSAAESVGRKPSLVRSDVHDDEFYEQLWRTVLAGETFSEVFVNRKKSGELYYEEKTISPLRDDQGRITHFISTGKDITERMQAQERLQHIAHHDALTGLPNRVLFLDRLEQALLRRSYGGDRVVGVMFLDLDRFKNVNDTLGHDVGDALLKSMAARLQGCVRESDSVARLGGDEFAVLLEDVAHVEDISTIAAKILGAFTLPFLVQGHELFITASIGISLYPNDGTSAATLLKNADAAMYRAKDTGKNNYQFYSADMSAAAFERLTLESSLRRALEREEFVLHYQPQIDLAKGQLIGVEALLRWQHPDFGLLAPTQFISIAEETGAIVPIGAWVARKAMMQVMQWRAAGFPELRVAVNVSGRQFNEPNFLETIAQLLVETNLPPQALELEITESVIMKNAEKTVERLRALHLKGVRFAIDDFGTGYSSLSYLRRFSINTLKIDKSFIRHMTADSGDVEIVKTIIMMARGLKLAVVAEGVETREQLMFLKSYGCHAVQGYLIARPLTAEALMKRLGQIPSRSWLP